MPRWSLSSSTSEFKRWSDSACGVVVDGDVGVRPAERWCDRCRLASRVGVGIIGGSELAEPRPGSSMGDRANGDETSTPSGAVAVGGRVGVSEGEGSELRGGVCSGALVAACLLSPRAGKKSPTDHGPVGLSMTARPPLSLTPCAPNTSSEPSSRNSARVGVEAVGEGTVPERSAVSAPPPSSDCGGETSGGLNSRENMPAVRPDVGRLLVALRGALRRVYPSPVDGALEFG